MFELFDVLARAGGGGSGGGGSGGGGGEGIILLLLIGYLLSYPVCMRIKRRYSRKAEIFVGSSYCLGLTFGIPALFALPFGAGGAAVGILFLPGVWIGWYLAYFSAWDRLKAKAAKVSEHIAVARQKDSIWNEQQMLELSKNVFMQFQQDWSTFNYDSIRTYTTFQFAERNILLLEVLKELGRTNVMLNVQIIDSLIIDIDDIIDNTKDTFTVAFNVSAYDRLIETKGRSFIYADDSTFTEYWVFTRNGTTWILKDIEQSTADPSKHVQAVQTFAESNKMHYSLDMGWLLLPREGLLFSESSFGRSDINNHVVGTHNGHLYQLYTYQDNNIDSKSSDKTYLVAQLILTQSYDGILVRPDKKLFSFKSQQKIPTYYQKYEFEWPDFNDRYDVFTTNRDRLAAFELINPGFMAYLYDSDQRISLEAAGNTVYLYKELDKSTATAQEYEQLLAILGRAFKELRL